MKKTNVMNYIFVLFCGLLLLSCSSTPRNPYGTNLIPMQDFFKNPDVAGMKVSPNGKFVAYLKPYQSRLNLFVQEIDHNGLVRGTEKRLTNQLDRDIRGFYWKEDETLLFLRDFSGDENFHIFRVNADGTGEEDLTPFERTRAFMIDDLEGINDHEIVILMNKRDERLYDVYRLNVKNGNLTMIAENPGNITGWFTDHDGKLRLATTTDGLNQTLLYRKDESQEFSPIFTTDFKNSLSPYFFTFDNKNLYVVTNIDRDKMVPAIFNLETQEIEEVLFEHPIVDVRSLNYSKKDQKITAVSYVYRKREYHFFDQKMQDIYTSIQEQIPGKEITLSSNDREEKRYIVRTYSDRSRGSYYLYDHKTKSLNFLKDLSPWLRPKDLAPMNTIRFTSRDGLTIYGYLTLPLNAEAKNLPIIVNPHGGPWARDFWGFNPEVQFLANRGYGVLQIDFRGSTGYGKDFWSKSFKRWGQEMQHDISDGVQYLIDKGIADPKRICIYGGSYGGYATLAGLTFTPDLYACGVSYVGVSNLFTFLDSIPPYWEPMRERLYTMIGHPEKDYELLKKASPLFHIDQMKAPLLVAHGAQDPRVKQEEADQIVDSLRERGIDVPYILKENEGHGFSNEENRFILYEAMEEFFAKHLLD